MPTWVKDHPIISGIAAVLFILFSYGLPAWQMFTSEPLIPTIAGWFGVPGMSDMSLSWLQFVGVPIGLIFLYLIWRETKRRAPVAPSVTPSVAKTVEFFPTRTELEEKYPLKAIFAPGNEIYAYFLSGQGVYVWSRDRFKQTKRLLLPRPNGSYMRMLQTLSKNEYLNAPDQIKTTTRLGQEYGVEIRWFDDFIGMALLFCNPEDSGGWVQIESSIPFVEAHDKHVVRIEKAVYPEFYKKLYAAYKKMWEESYVPKPEEYKQT
jgi:hypothetical protein